MRYQLFAITLVLVLLLAGCTNPLAPQITANATTNSTQTQTVSVDQVQVADITKLLESYSTAESGYQTNLQLKSSEAVNLIKLTYSVGGNDVSVYVTPDYQKLIFSSEISKTDLASQVSNQVQNVSFEVAPGDAPSEGQDSATVQILEFSDFQCPYCGKFYTDTMGTLRSKYVDTGKIKLYYLHFPLSFHPQAQPSAEAAACAEQQGKFWEMHDGLFNNQATLSDAAIKSIAKSIAGFDYAIWESCYTGGQATARVNMQAQLGSLYGVQGTPSFLLYSTKPLTDAQKTQIQELAGQLQGSVLQDSTGKTVLLFSGALPAQYFDAVIAAFGG